LTWAVATIIVAGVAAYVASATTGAIATTAANSAVYNFAYDADTLYRSPTSDQAASAPARAEAERILSASAVRGGLSVADHDYLVASIAGGAGVTAPEAAARIDAVAAREQQEATDARVAADKARKAAAAVGILTALSM